MTGFHGIKIDQIVRRLEKELQPAIKEHLRVAVEAAEDYLKKELSIPYKKHGASRPGEYPHRRTGSLKASVGHRGPVRHGNIYSILFGITKNNFQGDARKQQRASTLYSKAKEEHRKRVNKFLLTGRGNPGNFEEKAVKPPTKVTLYAKYLEQGTNKMAPRKLTRAAWEEAKRLGKIKEALKKLKGKEG